MGIVFLNKRGIEYKPPLMINIGFYFMINCGITKTAKIVPPLKTRGGVFFDLDFIPPSASKKGGRFLRVLNK